MAKLTKAQRRWLEAAVAMHPEAYFVLEVVDRGYTQMPLFRARLRSAPCPTCHRATQEQPVAWEVVDALAKAGMIAERVARSEHYYVTAAGRIAATPTPNPQSSSSGLTRGPSEKV